MMGLQFKTQHNALPSMHPYGAHAHDALQPPIFNACDADRKNNVMLYCKPDHVKYNDCRAFIAQQPFCAQRLAALWLQNKAVLSTNTLLFQC
jgi:hypothetical protein